MRIDAAFDRAEKSRLAVVATSNDDSHAFRDAHPCNPLSTGQLKVHAQTIRAAERYCSFVGQGEVRVSRTTRQDCTIANKGD